MVYHDVKGNSNTVLVIKLDFDHSGPHSKQVEAVDTIVKSLLNGFHAHFVATEKDAGRKKTAVELF